MTQKKFNLRGFTLIELLTVVAVVAVLAALLFLTIDGMQSRAKLTKCQSNLRQITAAGLLYTGDHDGFFPEGEKLTNPWHAGGRLPGEDPRIRPLNAYLNNNYSLFICPADAARYPPTAGAPAWAAKPFHESLGSSYFYNSYVGSQKEVAQGTQQSGLYKLRMSAIKKPSRMVFFADQDARVIGISGADWKKVTLWWHAKPNQQLRANFTFDDGSLRLCDIVPTEEAEYSFYNND